VTPGILIGWGRGRWVLTLYHPKTRIATTTTPPTTEPATIPAMGVDFDGDGVGVVEDGEGGVEDVVVVVVVEACVLVDVDE
jgi:hypothetical protein